jgi:hypothetical protein
VGEPIGRVAMSHINHLAEEALHPEVRYPLPGTTLPTNAD